jgi:Cof subfamily protein (haloacid dehalogenase superfamily)
LKTLYVTDLDGTLLNREDKLSDFTIETINSLISKGMCFSYATARSLSSASIVTAGLTTDIPVIVYNGVFILNAKTGAIISAIRFEEDEKNEVSQYLNSIGIYPLVYAFVNGKERVSWLEGKENEGMFRYINLRSGDKRLRNIIENCDLYNGDAFYFTCIGSRIELLPVYEKFKHDIRYTCTFQQELYREEYWCEIMPRKATKGNAINKLKEIAQCDRIVSFGDAVNDIPMFSISDECYAVNNAVIELKNIATSIIKANDEDGVAHWLEDNFSE